MGFLPLIIIFVFILMLAPKLAIATVVISLATGFVIKFTASLLGISTTITQSIKAALLSIFLNVLANQLTANIIPNTYISLSIVFILSTLAFSYILGAKFIQAIVISVVFWVLFLVLAFTVFDLNFINGNV